MWTLTMYTCGAIIFGAAEVLYQIRRRVFR